MTHYDPQRHINVLELIGTGTKNCYSDYEELGFMNAKAPWVQKLFESIQDIGKAFARDTKDPQGFMDTVFFSAVHLCHAFREAKGRISRQEIDNVVESVAYTLQTIQDNDYLVRSTVCWSSPDAYAEWSQSA